MISEEFPKELKYNKDYSWVRVEGNIGVVGVVSSAAKKIEEFVFINLPRKNESIKKGDNYVSLEAIKWSGHLKSPVSGKIIEVNESLFDEPSKINKDPYQSWIMRVELSNKEEIDSLMDSVDVKKYYEEN